MTEPAKADDLSTAIPALYRGSLEEFVTRRAALVKELRAAKLRDAADRVKALKKPSRLAWVLDSVVHEDPAALTRLDAALQQAQAGADLRTALEAVKTAVRDIAAVGARVAVRAGQPVDPSAVATAMYAVIGDAGALESLRGGQLVDVPDAGGLDMLALTVGNQSREAAPTPRAVSRQATNIESRTDAAKHDADAEAETTRISAHKHAEAARLRDERVKAARAELRRAEATLAEMGERSRQTAKVVLNARKELDAAEQALLRAQSEARSRRLELERVQDEATKAATALKEAEQSVVEARANVSL